MIQVKINGIEQMLPESWNELSKAAARVFAKCISLNMEEEEIKLEMLLHYFPELKKQIKGLVKNQENEYHQHFWEQVDILQIALADLFNFFWKKMSVPEEIISVVNSELSIQLLSKLKNLCGPSTFSKLEIWEFHLAELAWDDFFQTGNFKSLDRLVAILYRPKIYFHYFRKNKTSYKGDPRQEFNDQLIDDRMKSVATIPVELKLIVAWWFEGSLKQMSDTFPKLYNKKKSIDDESGEKGSWSDTILLIARNEHKEADQVAKRNLYQFMRERELQIIEREVQEKEMERMRNKK
jgi:hypothetical protein